jgi:ABC-type glycerol-3-phosphate transport system permease component
MSLPRSWSPLPSANLACRLLVLLVFLLPFTMGLVAAFRPPGEIFRYGIDLSIHTLIPVKPTLDNFRAALQRPHFVRQILNTLAVGLVQPTVTAVLALFAAFALARMEFRGRDLIFIAVLATLFIPFEAIVVPMFLVVRDLGMQGTFAGLVLPWIASPLAVFLLRQAMMEVPCELDEAILIDGGGLLTLLMVAILPNVWPALVTVWLFTFIFVWDSYLWPLVVLSDPADQMAQIGLMGFFGEKEGIPYGTVFAASVLAVGPVLVVFLLLQHFYVRGIALTGLR